MRILLVGEYSRLHNSLKEGLLKLDHEVMLVGTNDGFKNFPVDINYRAKFFSNRYLKSFVKLFYRLTSLNLIEIENGIKFYKLLPKLKGFDIVQLISEDSIKTHPKIEIWLLKKLIAQNNKLFLLSTGADYISISFALESKFRYSILTPYLENPDLKEHYRFVLKYVGKKHAELHTFLFKNIKGIISTDFDYHLPLENHPKYLGLIPNPINVEFIESQARTNSDKIIIFHGINKHNYIKKGNRFFTEALKIIRKKHQDKIEIISTENLPYEKYIKAYKRCHILLDQVYAYDQGYNALEAMANGKVVITGAEQEWLDHYNLKEDTIVINALPNSQKIAAKLEWLILNPEKLNEIGKNARNFVEREHHYINISKKYLEFWTNC